MLLYTAMISDNFSKIKQNIQVVCRRVDRDPNDVILVGASKYADAGMIKEAVNAGLKVIGENRVQDALEKFEVLDQEGIKVVKHLIGHLQSNKVKLAVENFDLIQSVDSLKLAHEIDKHAQRLNKVMDILVQVNTSGEKQKFGTDKSTVFELVKQIAGLSHIRVQGLMTMGPLVETEDREIVRQCFRQLKDISETIRRELSIYPKIEMKYLSMGMSGDYDIALEEGANMIRIGRVLFT
ncbi:MAG: YggS family pyridoxal phosphate-dependent enzyme [Candidatus Omnitrophica bacterium]|nr:YggS family pyridoxal phosphate-dependent enzyme [Candidatus Omnitrophota bacterium]